MPKVKYRGGAPIELVDESGVGQKVEPGATVEVSKAQADELLAVHQPEVEELLRPATKGRPALTRKVPNPLAGKPCRPAWGPADTAPKKDKAGTK